MSQAYVARDFTCRCQKPDGRASDTIVGGELANEIDYCADSRRAGPSEGMGGLTGSEERFLLRFGFSLVLGVSPFAAGDGDALDGGRGRSVLDSRVTELTLNFLAAVALT